MNLPNLDAFEARGLYNVDIDTKGARSVGQSAAGWATLRPKAKYPLLEKWTSEPGSGTDTVKFYWCSDSDREAARHFRICCQAYVLDMLPMKSDSKGKQKERRRRVLAWWEGDGLWLIVDEENDDISSLDSWWAGRLAMQQSDSPNGSANPDDVGIKRDSGGKIYADICDVFASMAEAIQVCLKLLWHTRILITSTSISAI
jgi:hypothetical protein